MVDISRLCQAMHHFTFAHCHMQKNTINRPLTLHRTTEQPLLYSQRLAQHQISILPPISFKSNQSVTSQRISRCFSTSIQEFACTSVSIHKTLVLIQRFYLPFADPPSMGTEPLTTVSCLSPPLHSPLAEISFRRTVEHFKDLSKSIRAVDHLKRSVIDGPRVQWIQSSRAAVCGGGPTPDGLTLASTSCNERLDRNTMETKAYALRPRTRKADTFKLEEPAPSTPTPSSPSTKLALSFLLNAEPKPEPVKRITSTQRAAKSRAKKQSGMTKEQKRRSRQCKIDGCGNYIINKGLCFRHGGGKQCAVEGCSSSAKNAGLCWKHGGSVKCNVQGCDRRGKSRGVCWAHGGGTRCAMDDCNKVAVSNGCCWAHGGGKRCVFEDCARAAFGRTHNYCNRHYRLLRDGNEVVQV